MRLNGRVRVLERLLRPAEPPGPAETWSPSPEYTAEVITILHRCAAIGTVPGLAAALRHHGLDLSRPGDSDRLLRILREEYGHDD